MAPNKENNKISLTEYWNKLNRHDWYYFMSDDHRRDGPYYKGKANEDSLKEMAEQSPAHKKMFEQFKDHFTKDMFSGGSDVPKPPKPKP